MKRSGLGQAPEMVLPVGLLLPLMRFGRVRDLLFRAKHLIVPMSGRQFEEGVRAYW